MQNTKLMNQKNRCSITYKGSPILALAPVMIFSQFAHADNIMSGLQKTQSYVKNGSIIVGTVAVIAAGLITAFNKERGLDKISGAVIGLACIAGASGIVAMIQSFFG